MPSLPELLVKVDELQVALDEEQVAIAAAIANLQAIAVDLQAQLAIAGTEAERQAILDKLNGVISDLQATIP